MKHAAASGLLLLLTSCSQAGHECPLRISAHTTLPSGPIDITVDACVGDDCRTASYRDDDPCDEQLTERDETPGLYAASNLPGCDRPWDFTFYYDFDSLEQPPLRPVSFVLRDNIQGAVIATYGGLTSFEEYSNGCLYLDVELEKN